MPSTAAVASLFAFRSGGCVPSRLPLPLPSFGRVFQLHGGVVPVLPVCGDSDSSSSPPFGLTWLVQSATIC
nr:MAG TPA: hypothetical protein [Caudoviricetes sp.]